MGRYTHLDVGVIILTVLVHMVLSTKVYRRTYEGVCTCTPTECITYDHLV